MLPNAAKVLSTYVRMATVVAGIIGRQGLIEVHCRNQPNKIKLSLHTTTFTLRAFQNICYIRKYILTSNVQDSWITTA